MANLPSLSNHDHRLYISSRAHHCGCLQLLLQIADIFAVTFASRQFVLFDFASTRTSSLLLSQVCEMYRTCFCASLWLASQSHLQCAAVLCSCSSCGSWASVWGILFGQHYLMQPLKVVVALNGRDWGDSHGFVRCHVSADATIHQNYEIIYSNVDFNNCIICLVISSLFLYVKLKIN